ncbi:MAG: phosphate ABC transporter substrate-binding protein [Deltaproteobacteria bacterium]|jgi:phosphate transport system substrate-binding protein|nr:phosphate ABC transporter substrate-binding protein [Deltaproteobacteria bacterium]
MVAFSAVALVFSLYVAKSHAADRFETRLMISGSTTVLPVALTAAEAYRKLRPEIQISVSGTGTGEGIKSLVDGNIDIAGASRDLLPAERNRASDKKETLERHTVALDSLAVIVHPENPVDDLSLAELEGIYDGTYDNWSELGGEDRPIIAINRDSSSGTFEMWLALVLRMKRYRRDAQVQPSSGGVAYAVGGNRNAIGYVGLGFLTGGVKVLTVGGVGPELENVSRGTYPLSRELYVFTREPASGAVRDFLAFLDGEEGRKIIEKEGFLPPPRKKGTSSVPIPEVPGAGAGAVAPSGFSGETPDKGGEEGGLDGRSDGSLDARAEGDPGKTDGRE